MTGLTFLSSGTAVSSVIHANDGFVSLGAVPAGIDIYTGVTGPATFGNGGEFDTNLGSGDFVGIDDSEGFLGVPTGYVSGHALTSSATWNNATFASLGVTPGTYVWTWGTGLPDQNVTLIIGRALPTPRPRPTPAPR